MRNSRVPNPNELRSAKTVPKTSSTGRLLHAKAGAALSKGEIMELIILMVVVWWVTRKIDDKGRFDWKN
jgi:hypothetical protein